MVNQELKEVKEKIESTLYYCNQVQYMIETTHKQGSQELHVSIRPTHLGNQCPNFSDSSNDCADCSFACGWHQIDGRCVPREGIDILDTDYDKLPIGKMFLPRRRRAIKNAYKIHKANGHRKAKLIEEEAVWV